MTVEEIFKRLSSHMIEGVMLHDQMSDYYDFLSLREYKRCHEYHAYKEMRGMRCLHRYFINHFSKLIEEDNIPNPNVIPSSWYRYTRQEVDVNTKRQAVKQGIEKWVAWETDTKALYQQMYHELMDLGEVAAAKKIACYICDVDRELKYAQRKHINLVAADYSMGYILGEQDHLHDWYIKKMKKHD